MVIVPAVDDDQLASWYRGATALLMPSLVEGFGLPALESLACGTVVVGSRGGAIEEVVGSAGILVDPQDVAEIASGLDIALEEAEGPRTSVGVQRAFLFSWPSVGARIRTHLAEIHS